MAPESMTHLVDDVRRSHFVLLVSTTVVIELNEEDAYKDY